MVSVDSVDGSNGAFQAESRRRTKNLQYESEVQGARGNVVKMRQ